MKQLRKALPVLLVLLLALGLFGCGTSDSGDEPASAGSTSAAPAEAEADEGGDTAEADDATAEEDTEDEVALDEPVDMSEAPDYEHGIIDGNVYVNNFFGFTFTADDDWSFADEDELSQLNQTVSDVVDNDIVTEALKNGSTFIDMQASYSENPLTNINLTVSYSPASKGAADFNDATISYMKKMYEDAGFEDVSITKTTTTVAGEEMDALLTTMTVQGNALVEKQIFYASNGYIGTLTVSGFDESDCDLLLYKISK